VRGKSTPDEAPTVAPGMTTLDRVHIAMLLQASGKSNALRTMLKAERERGPDFCGLPTRFQRCIRARVRKKGFWMLCCWRCRD